MAGIQPIIPILDLIEFYRNSDIVICTMRDESCICHLLTSFSYDELRNSTKMAIEFYFPSVLTPNNQANFI